MALLLMENFDKYNWLSDAYYCSHTSYVSVNSTRSVSGTQCLRCRVGYRAEFPIPMSNTGVIGVALQMAGETGGTGSAYFIGFYRGTSLQIRLHVIANGRIQLRMNTIVVATSDVVVKTNTRIYLEVKWNTNNSIAADTFVVLVNGQEVLNVPAGTDCQYQASPGVDTICLNGGSGNNNAYNYFDNLYILDLTGSAPYNDFLGEVSVDSLLPIGNGNSNQFIGSDADSNDNYLHVDELPGPDDDTSYVESSNVTDKDLYSYANLSNTPETVLGMQVTAYAKKDDSGTRTGKLITRVNSVDYEGSEFTPVEATYGYFTEIWALNPDDSAAWEEVDINSAEFGLKVES